MIRDIFQEARPAFWVERIDKRYAKRLCRNHHHPRGMPNSSKIFYQLLLNGKFAGIAIWGYGVTPTFTAAKLLGSVDMFPRYLELCRFFVVDGAPANTASRFLTTTHRLLRKDEPKVGLLYTYAAGFKGLVGTMYQAAGYQYVGKQLTDAWLLVNGSLYHRVSLWGRFGTGSVRPELWQEKYPGCKQWCGWNFRYVYWLDKKLEAEHRHRYEYLPYPTVDDIEVWTIDAQGRREDVPLAVAKKMKIEKMRTLARKLAG